jgi:hypothetical protein
MLVGVDEPDAHSLENNQAFPPNIPSRLGEKQCRRLFSYMEMQQFVVWGAQPTDWQVDLLRICIQQKQQQQQQQEQQQSPFRQQLGQGEGHQYGDAQDTNTMQNGNHSWHQNHQPQTPPQPAALAPTTTAGEGIDIAWQMQQPRKDRTPRTMDGYHDDPVGRDDPTSQLPER